MSGIGSDPAVAADEAGSGRHDDHDYKRHGTIDLFAAMNVGTGQVHAHLRKGHTGADVSAFFKQIDATVERGCRCT